MTSKSFVAADLHNNSHMEGKLLKLGGRIKISWQERYFFLKDGYLYYAKDLKDPEEMRFIDLRQYSIAPAEKQAARRFTIGLFNPTQKTYYLQASDQENMEKWLEALQRKDGEHITAESFDFLSVVGKGSFGKVMLVRKKNGDGTLYAMKILRKEAMIQKGQVANTLSERKILQKINHPFLVGLKYAFQNEDKLYMVLDYVDGGELFFHLQREGKFSESRARLYAAEIMLGLAHLHEMEIIYRDLKPENILLDRDGHVKLTDFGLAKVDMGASSKTNTFCGTPEYLAPEILQEAGHGKAVDWWSLGTLLYEMMAGLPPFYSQNVNVMYENILSSELRFPPDFSPAACDLLTKLLTRDPEKRLGSGPDGAANIKAHPFFASLNWDDVLLRRVKPEFKPVLAAAGDVSNFDEMFTSEQAVDSVVADNHLTTAQQGAFGGFSFEGDDAPVEAS
jgi:serine/threonine protein kinase